MTDETTQAVTPEGQEPEGKQTEQEQPKEPAPQWTLDDAIAEIKRLRAESGKYRTEAKAAAKARETAEAAALAEQGKYKELYEQATPKLSEYDTLKERYDAVMAQVQETNARRVKSIPDAMRSLVPEYDDPLKVAAWLDANAAVFQKPTAPALDGRAGGNSGNVGVTDEEINQLAARWRVAPEHIDRASAAKYLRGK